MEQENGRIVEKSNDRQAVSVAAFLRRNWKGCRLWQRGPLLAWVRWFVEDGRCGVVRLAGRIVGVGLVRIVYRRDAEGAEKGKDFGSFEEEKEHWMPEAYEHTEAGDTVWVDVICATERRAVPVLVAMMKQRCKGCVTVAGQVKGGPRVREMNLERASKLIFSF